MNISKTTLNFAEKRGLDITFWDDEEKIIAIWREDNEMEPLCFYNCEANGSFTFRSNCILKQDVKEELPYWVENEKKLRNVLSFLAENVI